MGVLLVFLVLPGGDEPSRGKGAYEAGRFEEAFADFTRAEREAGEKASAELLYNRSLAALRAGKLREAEIAAEKAAVRGGADFTPLRDFLLGNASFARCKQAEAKATGETDAAPFALDEALIHAQRAARFWQQAAMSRPDWPEARRNVERALLKQQALKKKKEAMQEEKKKIKDKKINPQPEASAKKPDAAPEARMDELSPEQIRRLLERLAEKEKQKVASRKERQRLQRAEVEKDW
jgi:hypothetical protein